MDRKIFVILAFALIVSSAHAMPIVADRFSVVADIAEIKPIPYPIPTEPIPPAAIVVTSTQSAGHSSSLSWHELQRSLYCSRSFDFKTRTWKICNNSPEKRANMIASWVKNRKKVHANIPAWITQ